MRLHFVPVFPVTAEPLAAFRPARLAAADHLGDPLTVFGAQGYVAGEINQYVYRTSRLGAGADEDAVGVVIGLRRERVRDERVFPERPEQLVQLARLRIGLGMDEHPMAKPPRLVGEPANRLPPMLLLRRGHDVEVDLRQLG